MGLAGGTAQQLRRAEAGHRRHLAAKTSLVRVSINCKEK